MATLVVQIKRREVGRYRVAGERLTIGRAPDNDVVLDNLGVSRRHASLSFRNGSYWIADEGSQNGVFLNGQRVPGGRLGASDTVHVGKFTLTIRPDDDSGNAPASLASPPKGPRAQQRTFALGANDLQKILQQPLPEPQRDTSPPERTVQPWGWIASGIALLAGLSWLVLSR